MRESPALAVVSALLKEGSEVVAFDPAAMERAAELLPNQRIAFAASAYEAAEGADALLILTDWEEFGALDLERIQRNLRYPIVVDGRNLYDPEVMAERGLIYFSVGRPDVIPEKRAAISLKAA